MNHNDTLRSVRYMLDISDNNLLKIIQLGNPDCLVEKEQVLAYLKKEDEADFLICPDQVMAAFLDGLIYQQRGKNNERTIEPAALTLSNNVVLKKLRIAFELKDSDVHKIMQDAGASASKTEMSALFRKPGHHNYRACGDQWLRNFLKGLTIHVRVDK